uniref:Putative fgf receptor activating protein n=1 Tax=Ixodes ricinus TaxID=34613 RepID=A0A131XWX1_IXORI
MPPPVKLVHIHFRTIAVVTALLPLSSFLTCIFYSLMFQFKQVTATHCQVANLLPSISAAIGSYTPQRYIWRTGIGLHAAPRLLVSVMYRRYYAAMLADTPKYQFLASAAFWLNVVENLCLLGLTNVSSSENYPIHEKMFVTFMVSALLYMLVSCFIPTVAFKHMLSQVERKSLRTKKQLMITSVFCSLLATYFFLRHNWYCEPGVYTFFALAEYIVVLCNIGFHMTAYWDFDDQQLYVSSPDHDSSEDKNSLLGDDRWASA